jgi:hypothetical protein
MRLNPWLLLFLFNHGLLFAQNQSSIDSLKSAFYTQSPSLEKAQLSFDIVKFYSRNNTDSTSKYLEASKSAVTKYGTKSMQARNTLDFANYLQNIGDFDQSIQVNQKAINQKVLQLAHKNEFLNSLKVEIEYFGHKRQWNQKSSLPITEKDAPGRD